MEDIFKERKFQRFHFLGAAESTYVYQNNNLNERRISDMNMYKKVQTKDKSVI